VRRTILSMPRGPRLVRMTSDTAFAASMFVSLTSFFLAFSLSSSSTHGQMHAFDAMHDGAAHGGNSIAAFHDATYKFRLSEPAAVELPQQPSRPSRCCCVSDLPGVRSALDGKQMKVTVGSHRYNVAECCTTPTLVSVVSQLCTASKVCTLPITSSARVAARGSTAGWAARQTLLRVSVPCVQMTFAQDEGQDRRQEAYVACG
jgi:hypothetical protein